MKLLIAVSLLATSSSFAAEPAANPPLACDACSEWNQPFEPFRVWGNTWYVGTKGLSAMLITSDKGHILIDGGLPQSAPLIAANIEKAGFHLEDVKLILNSHTHYDHAGGIAALQRASGAEVAASPLSKIALERGGPTEEDPQFAFGPAHNNYAPVLRVLAVRDGGDVTVGKLVLTAHFTPGHTPGGTTWTWSSCDVDNCMSIVYADSLNPVSAPEYRFSDHTDVVAAFLKSMDIVANLECGILLAPHPEFFDRDRKLAARASLHTFNTFMKRDECRSYAAAARQRLEKRLTDERASKS
jgi:metallo-beta-lactamase class B